MDRSYRLDEELDRGATGVYWRGTRLVDGADVTVKALLLRAPLGDEERGRFTREISLLSRLRHRGIPRYYEGFEARVLDMPALCVVYAFVPGRSLVEELGTPWTEKEVLDLAAEVLGILAYLHGLEPPLVHRDVCLDNLVRTSDHRLVLVGFGTVAGRMAETGTGPLLPPGTVGYMAPEQFQGRAGPEADLYGLGATMVTLLSGMEPQDLAREGRLEWRPHVDVGEATALLLERLLERDPLRRLPTVDQALAMVRAAGSGRAVQMALEQVARENAGVIPRAGTPTAPFSRRVVGPEPVVAVPEPSPEELAAERRWAALWIGGGAVLGVLILLGLLAALL